MDNCTHLFENTLTSSSQADFYILFLRKGKRSKTDKICKIFSHMNIYMHNHIYIIFICVHIAHEHIYLTPGTSHSVMNVRIAAAQV